MGTITYIYLDLLQTVSDCNTWQRAARSVNRGRWSPLFLSDMGVPGAQGARAGGLVGPQGENAWEMGGSPPDRVDQLFGFCTPFRPPVYNTPGVRGNGNTTLVGEG